MNGDVPALDFYGPMQATAVTDFVVVHPLAATSTYRYGQAGDAAKAKEEYKHGKYDEAAAAVGVRFIPFAVETYGKMGKEALRLLRTLQQDHADSAPPSALRPWHARSFVDSAVQRLSVALQRSIQRVVFSAAAAGRRRRLRGAVVCAIERRNRSRA